MSCTLVCMCWMCFAIQIFDVGLYWTCHELLPFLLLFQISVETSSLIRDLVFPKVRSGPYSVHRFTSFLFFFFFYQCAENFHAVLSFLTFSASFKWKEDKSASSETDTIKRSARVWSSLLLPVAFTYRLKHSTSYLHLQATLPQRFPLGTVEPHCISVHFNLGCSWWALFPSLKSSWLPV